MQEVYYIDGYNMLFRLLHGNEDLKTQRELLLKDLQTKSLALNLSLTIVFDSHYQKDISTKSHLNNLEIIYTAKGETADEYIFQMLKDASHPKNYTIVTSDKKLAWLCRRRLARTETVEEFIVWINRRYKNTIKRKAETSDKKDNPPELKKIQKKEAKIKEQPKSDFEYWLNAFENPFEKKENKPKSDLEYWLKAFENRSENSDS